MSERNRSKSRSIVPGSRVTLREDQPFNASRQHMRAHAMHGDVGTVLDPRRTAWPEWVLVRFDDCPTVHRLSEDEIVLARPSNS